MSEHDNIAWSVIDKYFKDNDNVLIRHHLDSYNDFFNNKIFNILNENNPMKILKDQDPDTKEYKLQADVYFGGLKGDQLYFGKPVIYDEDRQHYMYPNEARLRNMSYSTTLHMDVVIVYREMKDGKIVESEHTMPRIYFGKFPIMLNSDLCILNKLDATAKFNMGECKNDNGGYFIIDGKEKALINQEKFADNMFYIREDYNEIYSHSAEIRSVSEDASKPVRTLSVRIVRPSPKYKNGNIVVNIPNVRKPIPLFIVMRALGIVSDKAIIEYCLLDLERYENYIDLFVPSIHDAGNIFNQEVALKYIATFTKGKTLSHVLEILMDYFMPHVGENNFIDKGYFLGYMVNEILKVYMGDKKATDRDSFKFKRIESTGSLIFDLFKEYYKIQHKHIFQTIDKEYYYKQGIYQDDFKSLIQSNQNEIFKEKILDRGFRQAFKGSWGSEAHTKRPEVIQDLNRLSFNAAISHLRKFNLPLDASAKVIGPRLLHSSQWGIIDPVDSPDGGNIGLHKHMSLGAFITNGYSSKPIIELLRNLVFMEILTECTTEYISKSSKVFVNGAWVGVVTDPEAVMDILKKYRRLGLIPMYTSISWSIIEDTIYIYTDAGRLCRPVFYIEDNQISYNKAKVLNKLLDEDYTFSDLLIGFNTFKKTNVDKKGFIKSNSVYSNISDLYSVTENEGITIESKDKILEKLLETPGVIEYLDTAEAETTLIATTEENINKFTTHIEIHPSLLLGVMGNQIVFPENNQLPRDVFSCGQSKQGVSLYHSNHQNRIDKMGVVLNNGQIPLVKSRFLKYINNEQHPYGVNAIVAIGSYGGYNVEDSILFNEGSVKRGMFNTTYLNSYEAREESTKVASGSMDTKFANIESEPVIGKKPGYDYSELDEYGLIRENTPLDDKKVIIGKVTTDMENPDNYIDGSVTPKKGQLGFVDKSFITDGEEGYRIAKVRIREERVPAMGDKFCSRCGQKGTVGLIIPEKDMPFTSEGVRPDLIINPHALPSRMTIGQLIETLMGKACATYGGFGDCTAFANKGPKHQVFGSLLKDIGYNSSGNEVLYSGESGEQLHAELFIGPCYYMRLKHMVKDKINYRAQGPRTVLTRQTVQGRSNDGGLRIGEMERDCMIAHGATTFLTESMLKRGDEYYVAVCNNSGTIAVYNETKNIFISPFADGPVKFNTNMEDELNVEVVTKYGRDFSIVRVPYSFKLLMQELQVMNIQMRIITEDNVDQLTSMSYKNTVEIMKDRVLTDTQKSEFNKIVKTQGADKKAPKKAAKKPSNKEIKEMDEEPLEEELIDDDDDDLDPVTIEAVKRAELDFEKSQLEESDDDDEPKPPLTIGEQIGDTFNDFIETLTGSAEETPEKTEDTREVFEKEVVKVEPIPELEEDSIFSVETEKTKEVVKEGDVKEDDDNKNSSFTFDDQSKSQNRKTIRVDNQ
ncbi:RNA polymerase II [Phaeocystis globosa virus 12T]|uniref:DNA-directed RNA polymerase II subunit RPB2 n=1 Tax=Phaeocystis globosa virus PgV-16T TaxID=3071227 RepID=A0AC59EX53_9VIRU|nr:DNA-directed RNA polymerase II subunit RPB2 [Phaeocystis globosa virus]AET73056.1 RNA polymerase II [Phaeocystis globosa virus 12T]AET73879.1 RNA polymerase II [Phaeocystis globosa virus 14T]AGM15519.1 DNA-directed RNA polymerase II subunit RPB2 [Phaeocystis globosa virus PgV-16T]UYE94249.1 DNA-directed RNA polymerase II subunit RPB2 [Phaeocystis globosa virus]